jgi:cysteine synthase A
MTDTPWFVFVETGYSDLGTRVISSANALGCSTLLLTSDLTYYPRSAEIERLCRRVVRCATNSAEAVSETLAKENLSIGGIGTVSEHHVVVAAKTAAEFGCRGPSVAAVEACRDKLKTREACVEWGIPSPEYSIATRSRDVASAAERLGYPCVVKPTDGSGSAGVRLCWTGREAEAAAEAIFTRGDLGRGLRRKPGVLLEEYVMGYEVSVETFTVGGKTTVIGVTDKVLGRPPYFVELGHSFPSALPQRVVDRCASVAVGALDAVGFDFGLAHVELRVRDETAVLIELNARAAGDKITDLVELSSGRSPLEAWLRACMGDAPGEWPARVNGAAVRYAERIRGGDGGRGRDIAVGAPGVVEVHVDEANVGRVGSVTNSKDRSGYVVAVGESSYEAGRRCEAALAVLESV